MTCTNNSGKSKNLCGEECEPCCRKLVEEIRKEFNPVNRPPLCGSIECESLACVGQCNNPALTHKNACNKYQCSKMLVKCTDLHNILQKYDFKNTKATQQLKKIALEYLEAVAIYSHGMSGAEPCFCKHQNLCVEKARMILSRSPM